MMMTNEETETAAATGTTAASANAGGGMTTADRTATGGENGTEGGRGIVTAVDKTIF